MFIMQEFDFEHEIDFRGVDLKCRVEAKLSVDSDRVADIVSVRLFAVEGGYAIVPSDAQIQGIYEEIHERFEPDEPGDDWRNDWGD
jgi:hypothetical protein